MFAVNDLQGRDNESLKRTTFMLGEVVHTFNPGIKEAEAGGFP